ncbi:alpha-amylase family glycosyl hydrolase [Ferruginibacter albus]|uniref:alpha-amylase family glycosyl hydrolase n=1 Tax=Ferruginibacter albus TaxID=2875540 RepID=UPI001CC6D104|nr:alpha-amylase family glycosyl hydrolase [Ferruginibacter albus]UAY51871.1 hypothetical protein K9M53_14920 [Ferruginibacter albus]
MKKLIVGSLFSLLLISCHKDDFEPFTYVELPPTTDTSAQYGTPFAQVPDAKDAIIYEVNIRAFNGGTLQGVKNRLDSIKDLGVNVIYLMPVYPVGVDRSVNSPYCVKDYISVATQMGTLDDLRAVIDGAHQRGMAVIMDWVADHTSWDNPWIVNKAWYKQDGSGNIISPPNTGWTDVAQLNYDNSDMRNSMIRAMKYWIYTANIDGYRCDAADFIPADFWAQAIDTLRSINTHKLLMLAEGTRSDHFTSGFQLKYGMQFYSTLKDNIFGSNSSVKTLDAVNTNEYAGASGVTQQVMRYTTNHDDDLLDGTPDELFGGTDGAFASFVVACCMKGTPMIYNGQEVDYNTRLDYFNTGTPIDWTPKPAITSLYKKLIAFRKSSDAIKSGDLTSYSSTDVCAFKKVSGAQQAVVLVNLRNTTVNYPLPADLIGTTWNDVMNNGQLSFSTSISLPPYSYYILKN